MTWKSTAVLSGVTLVATWLGLTSGTPRGLAPAAPQADGAGIPAPATNIQQEAQRLQLRVREQLDYRPPDRNPFRFQVRQAPVAPSPQSTQIPPPPPTPAGPAPPAFTLAGIASDGADADIQRTAVISTPAGVLLVKEGDAVGEVYRVVKVTGDSVELARADDGSSLVLKLKP